jgi:hypothetical protein
MVVIDARAHSEHVQVIKFEIKLGSFERSRDVKNKAILEKIMTYNCHKRRSTSEATW